MSKRSEARSNCYRLKNVLVKRAVCPKCGAQKGEKCIGTRGLRTTCHKERWDEAGASTFSPVSWKDLEP